MSEDGKGLTKIVLEGASKSFARIFGPAGDEIAKLLEDTFRYWRWRNLHRIATRVEEFRKGQSQAVEGFSPLPEAVSARVIEAASAEDDPTLQEMWARLIANAVDPSKSSTVERFHIDLLRDMAPLEAKFLDALRYAWRPVAFETSHVHVADVRKRFTENWYSAEAPAREICLRNLFRKHLITFNSNQTKLEGYVRMSSTERDRYQNASAAGVAQIARNLAKEIERLGLLQDLDVPDGRTYAIWNRFQLSKLGTSLMQACELPS